MKRLQPESRIQRGVIAYLRAVGLVPVHVPNGSKLAGTPEQRARTGARLKADGLMPGFPDLLVYASDGRVGHMEIKAEANYQQDTQKACAALLARLGHHYAVVRSIDDARETLEEWGWI